MFLRIKNFFEKLALPTSQNEDRARSEFILNILLLAIIILSFVAFVINFIDWFIRGFNAAIPAGIIFIVFSFFVFLYFLSRRGFSRPASFALLAIFFLPVTYQIYSWGVDIPMAILSYALIIFIASILINTRFSFFSTIIISFTIAIIAYLQKTKIIETNRYWIAIGIENTNIAYGFLIAITIVEIIALILVGTAFFYLIRNNNEKADNFFFWGTFVGLVIFSFFAVGDQIFGDRAELLEHTIYWVALIISWGAYKYFPKNS